MTFNPARRIKTCPNHPHTASNRTGYCPGCCARAALPPDIDEIRRAKRAAAWKVRLSLNPALRREHNRRKHLRRKAKARAVAS